MLDQMNVPKNDRKEIIKEVHEGLKAAAEIKTISKGKISREELYDYVYKSEITLISEYGYNVDDDEELKFE